LVTPSAIYTQYLGLQVSACAGSQRATAKLKPSEQMANRHWLIDVMWRDGVSIIDDGILPLDASLELAWRVVAKSAGITEEALAARVAARFRLEVADLADLGGVDAAARKLLPERIALQWGLLPLRASGQTLTVATGNPIDVLGEESAAFASGRRIVMEIAPPSAVREAIEAHYAPEHLVESLLARVTAHSGEGVRVLERVEAETVGEKQLELRPVVQLTDAILSEAARAGASDIHIEPDAEGGRIRFRVDGVLTRFMRVPLPALVRVVGRIKILARLDIADRIRPQDGHFRAQVGQSVFDLRVSTVPTQDAEKCVIRLLPPQASFSLESLEFRAEEKKRIRELTQHREGIVAVAGPTGSGKTTTLYGALQDLSRAELNISTVEDPVEYELAGITQIQVEVKRGVTFASALRALLRQDPDVILVGEIRDLETAETAQRAGLTGHLVLTTLHTIDAAGAVARLLDIGLEPAGVASTLRGVIAQRLMRRLCPACSVPVTSREELPPRELRLAEMSGIMPSARRVGCPRCRQTGYQGRLPVAEVLIVTPKVAASISAGASIADLRARAIEDGMQPLWDSAVSRVLAGQTTLEEIERVGISQVARADAEADAAPIATTTTTTTTTMTTGGRGPSSRGWSIAVLPFVNLSPGESDRYFSDGITEDIVTCLAKIGGLKIISANATRRFSQQGVELRSLGESLSVGFVLDGSVRRIGDRVRITAQLFDAATGEDVWAERYDHELDDIFWVQSNVAQRIAEALDAALSPAEKQIVAKKPTANLAAYDLYLKGRFAWNERTESALRRSIRDLTGAVEQDPEFALALAALADSHLTLGKYGGAAPDSAMRIAREAADRALERDPRMAEALAARASVRAVYEWDWSGAERDFRRAISLHAGYATAHHWYAIDCLGPLGRFTDAWAALERAREVDPLSLPINATFGILAYFQRDFERAVAECRRVIQMDERFVMAHLFLGQALEQQGAYAEAIGALSAAVRLSGNSAETIAALAHAFAMAGEGDEARALVATLDARARSEYVSPTLLALAHLAMEDTERALDLLDDAHRVRAGDLVWVKERPTFDPIRQERRFQTLVGQIWRDQGFSGRVE
jgi:type IV pilus assembly protein PilB